MARNDGAEYAHRWVRKDHLETPQGEVASKIDSYLYQHHIAASFVQSWKESLDTTHEVIELVCIFKWLSVGAWQGNYTVLEVRERSAEDSATVILRDKSANSVEKTGNYAEIVEFLNERRGPEVFTLETFKKSAVYEYLNEDVLRFLPDNIDIGNKNFTQRFRRWKFQICYYLYIGATKIDPEQKLSQQAAVLAALQTLRNHFQPANELARVFWDDIVNLSYEDVQQIAGRYTSYEQLYWRLAEVLDTFEIKTLQSRSKRDATTANFEQALKNLKQALKMTTTIKFSDVELYKNSKEKMNADLHRGVARMAVELDEKCRDDDTVLNRAVIQILFDFEKEYTDCFPVIPHINDPLYAKLRGIVKFSDVSEYDVIELFRHKYSYAAPTAEALLVIVKVCVQKKMGIVEVGAGNCYWAMLLRLWGCDIIATDDFVDERYIHKGQKWITDYIKMDAAEAARKYSDRILMIIWPPPSNNMAFRALSAYTGDYLIYIGDGAQGITANDDFFNTLYEEWTILKSHDLNPVAFVYHDGIDIYQRNTSKSAGVLSRQFHQMVEMLHARTMLLEGNLLQ